MTAINCLAMENQDIPWIIDITVCQYYKAIICRNR